MYCPCVNQLLICNINVIVTFILYNKLHEMYASHFAYVIH